MNTEKNKTTYNNKKEIHTSNGFIWPSHYTKGNIQVIDIIRDQLSNKSFYGFCILFVLKYLIRVLEGDMATKLRGYSKAKFYLNELIKTRKEEEGPADESRINPKYYTQHQYEVVDILEDQFNEEMVVGAYTGTILKYLLRSEAKHGLEDYQKAYYFLERLIEYCKKHTDNEEDEYKIKIFNKNGV